MTKYVFSYRVPADFVPGAGTGAEWEAWLASASTAYPLPVRTEVSIVTGTSVRQATR